MNKKELKATLKKNLKNMPIPIPPIARWIIVMGVAAIIKHAKTEDIPIDMYWLQIRIIIEDAMGIATG